MPFLMIFVGQGGTLANLRGFLLHGGCVIGGTVLTGKPYSRIFQYDEQQAGQLLERQGPELESRWAECFGFGYNCHTRSEARYLLKTRQLSEYEVGLSRPGKA
jgi:hypothetical protein